MTAQPLPDESSNPVYAGFWIRVWASLIDSVLVAVVILPLLSVIYGPAVFAPDGPLIMGPAHVLISYILPALAVIVFWMYREATPGKMAIGAHIVDATTGRHPRTAQFVIRYLGYFAASLPLGIGLLWVGVDSRKQGWHDKIANTVVIRTRAGTTSAEFTQDRELSQPGDDGRWQA